MKTFRMFATTLMMVVLCLNFVACDDDDDNQSFYPTAEELVGTTWVGTNAGKDVYEIKLTSTTDLILNLTSEDGEKYVDNAPLKYNYNAENGTFTSNYEGQTVSGNITTTSMSFTFFGEKITLKKK